MKLKTLSRNCHSRGQAGAIHLVPLVIIAAVGLYLYFAWPSVKAEAARKWEDVQFAIQGVTQDMQRSVAGFFEGLMGGHLGSEPYEGGVNVSSGAFGRLMPGYVSPVKLGAYYMNPKPIMTNPAPVKQVAEPLAVIEGRSACSVMQLSDMVCALPEQRCVMP